MSKQSKPETEKDKPLTLNLAKYANKKRPEKAGFFDADEKEIKGDDRLKKPAQASEKTKTGGNQ